jgi:hypothetical protein
LDTVIVVEFGLSLKPYLLLFEKLIA